MDSDGAKRKKEIGGGAKKYNIWASRFKTKQCEKWAEFAECAFGLRCMFAHGEDDLRSKERNFKDGLIHEDAIRRYQDGLVDDTLLEGRPPLPGFLRPGHHNQQQHTAGVAATSGVLAPPTFACAVPTTPTGTWTPPHLTKAGTDSSSVGGGPGEMTPPGAPSSPSVVSVVAAQQQTHYIQTPREISLQVGPTTSNNAGLLVAPNPQQQHQLTTSNLTLSGDGVGQPNNHFQGSSPFAPPAIHPAAVQVMGSPGDHHQRQTTVLPNATGLQLHHPMATSNQPSTVAVAPAQHPQHEVVQQQQSHSPQPMHFSFAPSQPSTPLPPGVTQQQFAMTSTGMMVQQQQQQYSQQQHLQPQLVPLSQPGGTGTFPVPTGFGPAPVVQMIVLPSHSIGSQETQYQQQPPQFHGVPSYGGGGSLNTGSVPLPSMTTTTNSTKKSIPMSTPPAAGQTGYVSHSLSPPCQTNTAAAIIGPDVGATQQQSIPLLPTPNIRINMEGLGGQGRAPFSHQGGGVLHGRIHLDQSD